MNNFDTIRYRISKSYNGMEFWWRSFKTLKEAQREARDIVTRENRGRVLTVRIWKQVGFSRQKQKNPTGAAKTQRRAAK